MPELRDLTGQDLWVRDFVLSREEAGAFLEKVVDLVRLLAPRFVAEQKPRLVLAVGCTGGRHRSVALVEELARQLQQDSGLVTSVTHRDIERKE
jgi:UPF0042 nucleotide-binding protein